MSRTRNPRHARRAFLLAAALVLAAVPRAGRAGEPSVEVTVIARQHDRSLVMEHRDVPESEVQATLAALDARPDVITAGVSQSRSLLEVDDPLVGSQWGWERLGGNDLAEVGNGQGVTVAVLDTGVDAAHPDLGGRVLPGWDSMVETGDGRVDPNGHGTHVAGIIAATADNATGVAGVAPAVDILPVRVLDASGNGDDDELAYGIIWAVDHGADILNLSIGGAVPSSLLEGSIDYALSKNVLVVVAAGNNGATGNEPSYPGAYAQVLAVGATDSSDRRSLFSNTGSYLDLTAPGSWIVSTWPGGRYQTSSGTSMAAPFVAAAAALLQARTGVQGRALGELLVAGAVDLGPTGHDDAFGAGLVNPLAAIGRTPAPIPENRRAPVLPGLPGMPALPELRVPELPALVPPPVPTLPPRALPPLPSLPPRSAPARPDLTPPALPSSPSTVPPSLPMPERRPTGTDLRSEVTVTVRPRSTPNGTVLDIRLVGPAPVIARQRLLVATGSKRYRVLTDWKGRATLTLTAASSATVTLAGSSLVRPVSVNVVFRRR